MITSKYKIYNIIQVTVNFATMIGFTFQGLNTENITQNKSNYSDIEGNMLKVKMELVNNNVVQHDSDNHKTIEVNTFTANYMEDEPQWKKSICSKGRSIANKTFPTSIHHRYSILSKTNPKLSSCIKAITQQIRNQILRPIQSPKIQQQQQGQTFQTQLFQEKYVANKIINEQIIPDKVIVKESCYRGLLKPTQTDNDVPSDEQDLNNGIRYMYGQLLYSVGSEMVNQRQHQKHQKTKPIAKQNKKPEHDKQNINTNLPQETKAKTKVFKTNQRLIKPKGDISRPNLMVRH